MSFANDNIEVHLMHFTLALNAKKNDYEMIN